MPGRIAQQDQSPERPQPERRTPPHPLPRPEIRNPFVRQLPLHMRVNVDQLLGPNQTDAILFECKDLLKELILKAENIEQLLRIIHYSLDTRPAPNPNAYQRSSSPQTH
jgi:hypothetical protein